MRLSDGVYFFECDDMVYLRNVNDGHDYSFNAIVYDILQFIKENPGCTEESLCNHLAQIYEVSELAEFYQDIHFFLEELEHNRLIQREKVHQEQASVTEKIQRAYVRAGKIYSVGLELTYRCSEKCIHCYVDDNCAQMPQPELSFEEYKDILHQLKEMGCISLLLTGGEVCLRKDLVDIARYAVELGFLVDVYTNGISMTDEQFDVLCALKPNSVSFSLYSGDPKVHDAITQIPGSFEKTMKRILMFKCAGVDTYIKTVVIRQNLDTLEKLFKLGKRIHIDVVPATSISDTHLGQSAQRFRLDTPELRKKALDIIGKYGAGFDENIQRDVNAVPCKSGIIGLSIDPYGGVHPCLSFTKSLGSVRETSIKDIWENNEFLKVLRAFRFRDLSAECEDCKYHNHCTVCIGAAYEASGGKLCPSCDSCDWAKSRYEAGMSGASSCG